MNRTAIAVVVALLAGVAGTQTAAGASVARCADASVVVWLDTSPSPSAGSSYVNVKVTNLAAKRCALRGYPGVSAVDLGGRQLGSAAAREGSAPTHSIVLGRGDSATALVRITDVGVFPPASCHTSFAAGLRVYLPDSTASKIVPFPVRACSRTGRAYLHVHALTTGRP